MCVCVCVCVYTNMYIQHVHALRIEEVHGGWGG